MSIPGFIKRSNGVKRVEAERAENRPEEDIRGALENQRRDILQAVADRGGHVTRELVDRLNSCEVGLAYLDYDPSAPETEEALLDAYNEYGTDSGKLRLQLKAGDEKPAEPGLHIRISPF